MSGITIARPGVPAVVLKSTGPRGAPSDDRGVPLLGYYQPTDTSLKQSWDRMKADALIKGFRRAFLAPGTYDLGSPSMLGTPATDTMILDIAGFSMDFIGATVRTYEPARSGGLFATASGCTVRNLRVVNQATRTLVDNTSGLSGIGNAGKSANNTGIMVYNAGDCSLIDCYTENFNNGILLNHSGTTIRWPRNRISGHESRSCDFGTLYNGQEKLIIESSRFFDTTNVQQTLPHAIYGTEGGARNGRADWYDLYAENNPYSSHFKSKTSDGSFFAHGISGKNARQLIGIAGCPGARMSDLHMDDLYLNLLDSNGKPAMVYISRSPGAVVDGFSGRSRTGHNTCLLRMDGCADAVVMNGVGLQTRSLARADGQLGPIDNLAGFTIDNQPDPDGDDSDPNAVFHSDNVLIQNVRIINNGDDTGLPAFDVKDGANGIIEGVEVTGFAKKVQFNISGGSTVAGWRARIDQHKMHGGIDPATAFTGCNATNDCRVSFVGIPIFTATQLAAFSTYVIETGTIAFSSTAGAHLAWTGNGWNGIGASPTRVKLASDWTSTTSTLAQTITGFQTALKAATTYRVIATIAYQSSSLTTGMGVALNVTAPTLFVSRAEQATSQNGSTVTTQSNTRAPGLFFPTSTVDAADSNMEATINALLTTSAAGDLNLRIKPSGVGGGVIKVLAGSVLELTELP